MAFEVCRVRLPADLPVRRPKLLTRGLRRSRVCGSRRIRVSERVRVERARPRWSLRAVRRLLATAELALREVWR